MGGIIHKILGSLIHSNTVHRNEVSISEMIWYSDKRSDNESAWNYWKWTSQFNAYRIFKQLIKIWKIFSQDRCHECSQLTIKTRVLTIKTRMLTIKTRVLASKECRESLKTNRNNFWRRSITNDHRRQKNKPNRRLSEANQRQRKLRRLFRLTKTWLLCFLI